MRSFLIEDSLKKTMEKLVKKDKHLFYILHKKINEILNCEDVNHYKNLRVPLQAYKRVHINKSFVLLFKYDESKDKVIFFDFDHHDNIYKK